MNKEGYVKNGGMGVKKIVNHKMMDQKDIDRLIEDAWLGLDIREEEIYNPIKDIPEFFHEEPHLFLTWVMSRPEYISLFCKEVMNVQLFPLQALIIHELWNHKFPILLGSRGLGKSFLVSLYCMLRAIFLPGRKIIVVGSAFRQAKLVFEYCETIWRGAPLLRDLIGQGKRDDQIIQHDSSMWSFKIGESRIHSIPMGDGSTIRGLRANDTVAEEFACLGRNTIIQTEKGLIKIEDYLKHNVEDLLNMHGEMETPDCIYKTPMVDVYKVTTQNGYSFKCSEIHQTWTSNGWKLCKDLTKDDWLELDTNDYFPEKYVEKNGVIIDENYGWLLGVLVAEGTNTNRNVIKISNTDTKLIQEVQDRVKLDWKISTREEYTDGRGWKCKESYEIYAQDTKLRETLYELGLDYTTSHKKQIPWCILQSPRSVVIEYLKGAFWGDGSGFVYYHKGKKNVGMAYYSVCEELVSQMQILLLKFGITSSKNSKMGKLSTNPMWMLSIRAENAVRIYDLLKLEKWTNTIKDADYLVRKPSVRKNGNRWVVESTRLNKHAYIGTFDTEQEGIDAFNSYWRGVRPAFRVKSVEKLPEREVLYDFHLPKTHSFIGNGFIQHNSINRSVFENVVAGFGVVAQDPVENLKHQSRKEMKKKLGIKDEESIDEARVANQIILSGTAYYRFNHFFTYFEKYRNILRSCGDIGRLEKIVGEESRNPDFNWRDYCIIRIPYDLTAQGYYDNSTISRNKVNTLASNFLAEYYACFPADSDGFFKRSLIEKATPSNTNKIEIGGKSIDFVPHLVGNPLSRYVIAIDPASEEDNCALIILELMDDHRRVVYSWTTNKKLHRRNLTIKKTDESNYWAFVVRKIRNLMVRFPTVAIVIDSQGGGNAIREGLSDKDKLQNNEQQIWPIINQQKQEYSDTQEGLHIIHMFNFASNELLSNAYFNTKKDLDTQQLVFPSFDGATLGLVECETDDTNVPDGGLEDTLEGIVEEIEELKNELTCIMHTKLPSGRDQFSVPDIKTADGKKARVKKDRASALIMANSTSRAIMRDHIDTTYESNGGYATPQKQENGLMYSNVWYGKAMQDAYADL